MNQPSVELLSRALISKQREMPLHLQVRGALRRLIEDHFEDGQSFWTEALLMENLDVSRATVRQALADLSREGLLIRQAARGTSVRKKIEATTIGFFVHQYNSDFQSELLHAFAEECRKRSLTLQPYHTHNGEQITEAFERVRLPASQQRFVILGESEGYTGQLIQALTERGYRSVLVDTISPGFRGSYVGTDNALAARIGLDHLRHLGHRRIVLLVNEPAMIESVRRKIAAFEEICRSEGLTESRVVLCGTQPGQSSFDAAYRKMKEVWNQTPRPTAIFTLSDPGAWAVLKWCSERQITVPAQLSVLGFEGVPRSRFTHPALTTVAHPFADLARRALDLLWEQETRQEFLTPTLILGESTGSHNL